MSFSSTVRKTINDALNSSGKTAGDIIGPPSPGMDWVEYEQGMRDILFNNGKYGTNDDEVNRNWDELDDNQRRAISNQFVKQPQGSKKVNKLTDPVSQISEDAMLLPADDNGNDDSKAPSVDMSELSPSVQKTIERANKGHAVTIDPHAKPEDIEATVEARATNHLLDDDKAYAQDAYKDYFNKVGYDRDDEGTWKKNDGGDLEKRTFWDVIGDNKYYHVPDQQEYLDSFDMNPYAQPMQIDGADIMNDSLKALRDQGTDNGTLHPEALTSNTMSGSQYKIYAELTGTGRPVDDIDPYKTYSKIDEAKDHGFIPYLPDGQDSLNKMMSQELWSRPSKIANGLADIREEMTPYVIKENGNEYDGHDVEERGRTFIDNIDWNISQSNKNGETSIYADPNADHTGMDGYVNTGWVVNFEDGTSETYDGPFHVVKYGEGEGDPVIIGFNDGTEIEFNDAYDVSNSMFPTNDIRLANDGEEAIYWYPRLTLEDGQTLTYDQVLDYLTNAPGKEDSNQNIEYDFGPLNIGKPARMSEGLIEDGFAGLLPNTIDLVTGSAPYFHPLIGVPVGLSGAASVVNGQDAMGVKTDGSGDPVNQNGDSADLGTMMLANAAMPLTEVGYGRIGKTISAPFMKTIARNYGNRAWYPMLEHLSGTVGEGMEEIPGNVTEELARNGLSGAFADQAGYDDNGNVLYDSKSDRIGNFVSGIPDAFAGGAWLGTLFGLPTLPGAIGQSKANYDLNKNLKNAGVGVYRNGRKVKQGAESYPLSAEHVAYLDENWNR